jgi:hypothetical protein
MGEKIMLPKGFTLNKSAKTPRGFTVTLLPEGFTLDEKPPDLAAGKPSQDLAEQMVSRFAGLDRLPVTSPAPFAARHPNIAAAGQTLYNLPGAVGELGEEIVSGVTYGGTDRAEEAADWLVDKLFPAAPHGATGTWEEETKLPGYVKTGAKLGGRIAAIGGVSKMVGLPLIQIIGKSKYLAPLAQMIGWGSTGITDQTLSGMIEEGELPTPKELAKHGATWAAFAGVISTLGWGGRLAIGLQRLHKTWGIPRKEVLKIVLGEAKKRKMPIAQYFSAKGKVQKALSKKELQSADKLLKVFEKKGTYPDLVKQMEGQAIEARIKAFKGYTSTGKVLGAKVKPKKIITKEKGEIERILLKPGYARTAEDIALLNRTKPGLHIPTTDKDVGKVTKLFPKPPVPTIPIHREPITKLHGMRETQKLLPPGQGFILKEPQAKVVASPTEATLKAAKRHQAMKKLVEGRFGKRILDEKLPDWVRKTGDSIRFHEPVSKEALRRYQHYFATRPVSKTPAFLTYSTKVSKKTIKPAPALGSSIPLKQTIVQQDKLFALKAYKKAIARATAGRWRNAESAAYYGKAGKLPIKTIVKDLRKAGYEDIEIVQRMKHGGKFNQLDIEVVLSKLGTKKPDLKAAIKFTDGKIIKGQTHAEAYGKISKAREREGFVEGFVDTKGNFLTRKQSLKLHKIEKSEQLRPRKLQRIYERLARKRLNKPVKTKIGDVIHQPPSKDAQLLITALRSAKIMRGKQEAIYTKARGAKLAKAKGVAATTSGRAGFHAEVRALGGKMETVAFAPILKRLGPKTIDRLFDQVKNCPTLQAWEVYPARKGLEKLFGEYGGAVPTEGELKLLYEALGPKLVNTLKDKGTHKFRDWLYHAVNLPKAIRASYDVSAGLRQGLFFIGRPKQWLPAFRDQFKYLVSRKSFEAAQEEIKTRPMYELMVKSKLSLTDLGPLSAREEAFQSRLAEYIPGVRASSQAFTGFLNQLRVRVFEDLAIKGKRLGYDKNPKFHKDLADYVNHATGRGHLKKLESMAVELNLTFFSPRLIMSRLQLLNPVYYKKLAPAVRKEALRDLFSVASMALTVGGLGKLGGLDVVADPRNADFLKLKVGNTRYDVLGGFQQPIRAAAQFISGVYVNSVTGKPETLGEGYKPTTRSDIALRFFKGKLSPAAAFVTTLLGSKSGVEGRVDVPTELGEQFVPMALVDLYDLYNEKGKEGIPMAVPAFLGVGVQTYGGVQSYGGKEYYMYNSKTGKKIAQGLTQILKKRYYLKATDDEKKYIIERAIDHFKAETKQSMFPRKKQLAGMATHIRTLKHITQKEALELAKERLRK